jgi:hypothetical protein
MPWQKHFSILCEVTITLGEADGSVDIETGYGLDDTVSILCWARDFSLLHSVQNGPEAQPASCPVGTGELFPRA